MRFTSLLTKIHLKVISHPDYESLISCARTSRYFKNITPHFAVFSALVDLEHLKCHNRETDWFETSCYGCLRVRGDNFDYHDGKDGLYHNAALDPSGRRCMSCRMPRLERTGSWVGRLDDLCI
jgi:hypothetical protein